MAYSFAVDSAQISGLAESLEAAKTTVGSGIEGIFSDIDGMEADSWKGSSYEDFKGGAHKYETALRNVPEVIGAFKKTLEDSVTPAETVVKNIKEALNSINK